MLDGRRRGRREAEEGCGGHCVERKDWQGARCGRMSQCPNCDRKLPPRVLVFVAAACVVNAVPASAQQLSPDEARAIAKEATIYGFPLVDSYRVQYSYFVDRSDPDFKAPWNTLVNNARLSTPDDKADPVSERWTPPIRLSAPTCAPSRWSSPCRRSRRIVTIHSSSSTCTRSTSPTWAAGPRATTQASSCWRGRTGEAKSRPASRR